MKISTLTENPINPRNISREQMDKLKASIERDPEFLTLRPIIVDGEGIILAGNQRLAALRELGRDEVPDEWVRVIPAGMEDDKVRRFILIDNSPDGISGEWDFQLLAENFGDLDLDLLGLDLEALADAIVDGEDEDDADAEPQTDRAEELRELWQTEAGQLWRIGEHRLLCGDSTKAEDVGRLMGGEKADMMFTDPPYGVNYSGGIQFQKDGGVQKNNREKLKNDNTTQIYFDFLPVALPVVDGPCYMWFAGSRARDIYNALHDCHCEVHALIIWHKTNATYAAMNAQYKQRHEPCLYFKPKGSNLRWCGATTESTVWSEDRDGINDFHPTQKPISLATKAIGNHEAKIIIDAFLGSGSTMVAAQNLNRKCYGLEISPAYCAVILQRMKDAFPDIEIKKSDA